MRTLRIMQHTSIDGVIQPGEPGDDSAYSHGGWTAPYRSPEGLAAVIRAQGPAFDLVLGRRTYDLWSTHWPKAPTSALADAINAATKLVATHRPDSLAWGPARALGPDAFDAVRRLKAQPGPDLITWGSATLASQLLARGLADELVLVVYPLLLGRGKRFFSDAAPPSELRLVASTTTPTGLTMNTYRHVGPLAPPPPPPAPH